jgi:signal transduction histidine kinase
MQQSVHTAGFNSGEPLVAGLSETVMGVAGAGPASFSFAEEMGLKEERRRVEAMVETLADLRGESESLAAVAHDARNMVTALGLYCDLLEEPGVLHSSYRHYGNELRLVATASRRLVEKLVALDARSEAMRGADPEANPGESGPIGSALSGTNRSGRTHRWDLMPAAPINDLAAELRANRNLLAALAGASIVLTVEVEGGAQPVRLTGEDLTRILVNLVKNAAEAMPEGGSIRIGLRERLAANGRAEGLSLTIEDSGPGIPGATVEKIFDSGYTTRANGSCRQGDWPASHRGLGLSITRSIVESAGGEIHAANLIPHGARFEIDLPARFH